MIDIESYTKCILQIEAYIITSQWMVTVSLYNLIAITLIFLYQKPTLTLLFSEVNLITHISSLLTSIYTPILNLNSRLWQSFSKNKKQILSKSKSEPDPERKLKEEIAYRKQLEETLKKTEEKFNKLYYSAGNASFIYQYNRIIDCNEKALTLLKATKKQLIGLHPWDFSPEYQPDGLPSKLKAEKLISEIKDNKPKQFEWQHLKMDGELIDVEVNLNIINLEEEMFMATFWDISPRKKQELAIIESEKKFRNIFNTVSDAILITDLKGDILEANDVAINRDGYTKEELIGLNINYLISSNDLKKMTAYRKIVVNKGYGIFEITHKRKSGELIPVEINVKLTTYNDNDALIIVSRDISERKYIQRQLYRTMIESEEKERERYAKELHDGLGPILSTCKIYFYSLNVIKDIEKQKQYAARAGELLEDALQSIKDISNNLSPHILRNYGLTHALQSFAAKLAILPHTKIIIKSDLNNRISDIIEFTLYRTLVELINNSVKYSKASKIELLLSKKDNKIHIAFSDNGIGFDFNKLKQHGKGFGLLNFENRIHEIGGEFNINSKKGKGVQIQIVLKEQLE